MLQDVWYSYPKFVTILIFWILLSKLCRLKYLLWITFSTCVVISDISSTTSLVAFIELIHSFFAFVIFWKVAILREIPHHHWILDRFWWNILAFSFRPCTFLLKPEILRHRLTRAPSSMVYCVYKKREDNLSERKL